MDVIATPFEKLMPFFGERTAISDSLFERTKSPTRSESRGRPEASSFMCNRSGIVPITPPARMTRSAVNTFAPAFSNVGRVSML
jgi:hypothetical protein